MPDQDENKAIRITNAYPVSSQTAAIQPPSRCPIEELRQCVDASGATIAERLAAPDVADIAFEAPQSKGLFRAADLS